MGDVFGGGNPIDQLNRSVFGDVDSGMGKWASFISDPLDLRGTRAENTRDTISGIARQSAADAIGSQEEMRRIIEGLMAPYQQQGEGALGDFTAMATGGGAATSLSPEYLYQREQGLQNINRGMGAAGRRLSTARDKQTGGFLNALGQEEAGRQWQRTLDPIKTAQGALGAVGGAGASAGQNIGSMYGNLGNALNMGMQNYGQQRQQSLQGAGNALQGLGAYLAYNQ